MPRKCPLALCEVGAAVGNSRRQYFWRNRGCSMCRGCGQDRSRVRIIKMHACLRHSNDWATTTNIINKNKVTRDAAVFALFTNPPLSGVASLSVQYWRIGNVIVGSFLLVINSMTLYSIWNMIYNLISE